MVRSSYCGRRLGLYRGHGQGLRQDPVGIHSRLWQDFQRLLRLRRHPTGPVRVLEFSSSNSSADGSAVAVALLEFLAHHPVNCPQNRNQTSQLLRVGHAFDRFDRESRRGIHEVWHEHLRGSRCTGRPSRVPHQRRPESSYAIRRSRCNYPSPRGRCPGHRASRLLGQFGQFATRRSTVVFVAAPGRRSLDQRCLVLPVAAVRELQDAYGPGWWLVADEELHVSRRRGCRRRRYGLTPTWTTCADSGSARGRMPACSALPLRR